MPFTTLTYRVEFTAPAFLGNAQQQAQWRTPPFKALLREWWRISQAKRFGYDVHRLRAQERDLFGAASDSREGSSGQSKIRLRLSRWNEGTRATTGSDLNGFKVSDGKMQVSVAVYLGYGPVSNKESRNAIVRGEQAELIILVKDESVVPEVRTAMKLASWFGTLGSRSRNGWGSISLNEIQAPRETLSARGIEGATRPWQECLNRDWPHAVGSDEKDQPLIWFTEPQKDWREAFRQLGQIRKDIDHQIPRNLTASSRSILSYPVTDPYHKYAIPAWGAMERIPSQLRVKLIQVGGKYRGQITHVPCSAPAELVNKANLTVDRIRGVWEEVHRELHLKETSAELKLTRLHNLDLTPGESR